MGWRTRLRSAQAANFHVDDLINIQTRDVRDFPVWQRGFGHQFPRVHFRRHARRAAPDPVVSLALWPFFRVKAPLARRLHGFFALLFRHMEIVVHHMDVSGEFGLAGASLDRFRGFDRRRRHRRFFQSQPFARRDTFCGGHGVFAFTRILAGFRQFQQTVESPTLFRGQVLANRSLLEIGSCVNPHYNRNCEILPRENGLAAVVFHA